MQTITIGRSSRCDIVVSDSAISRVHAQINYDNKKFWYRNLGKNGSTLNGKSLGDVEISIEPGAPILMANRVPLPWAQIYALLPSNGDLHRASSTGSSDIVHNEGNYTGLCILSFIIPLVGFILYFTEKTQSPYKSSLCLKWAGIGFALNLLLGILVSFS